MYPGHHGSIWTFYESSPPTIDEVVSFRRKVFRFQGISGGSTLFIIQVFFINRRLNYGILAVCITCDLYYKKYYEDFIELNSILHYYSRGTTASSVLLQNYNYRTLVRKVSKVARILIISSTMLCFILEINQVRISLITFWYLYIVTRIYGKSYSVYSREIYTLRQIDHVNLYQKIRESFKMLVESQYWSEGIRLRRRQRCLWALQDTPVPISIA